MTQNSPTSRRGDVMNAWLRLWRYFHPARRRWVPLRLWWALKPPIRVYAKTNASLDQSGFQFYENDGDEANSTAVAAEDTNATLSVDTVYHIRIQVDDTASGGENNVQLQLQYNLNSAGWNPVNATSSVVQSSASTLTDQADTTARLTAPSGGSFITPNGGQDESDGTVGDSNEIDFVDGTHDYVEAVYAFQILSGDVQDSDTIQFRVVRTPSTVLESYTLTPQATVSEAAAATELTGQSDGSIQTTATIDVIEHLTGQADTSIQATGSLTIIAGATEIVGQADVSESVTGSLKQIHDLTPPARV